jgi:hypothetical protein
VNHPGSKQLLILFNGYHHILSEPVHTEMWQILSRPSGALHFYIFCQRSGSIGTMCVLPAPLSSSLRAVITIGSFWQAFRQASLRFHCHQLLSGGFPVLNRFDVRLHISLIYHRERALLSIDRQVYPITPKMFYVSSIYRMSHSGLATRFMATLEKIK